MPSKLTRTNQPCIYSTPAGTFRVVVENRKHTAATFEEAVSLRDALRPERSHADKLHRGYVREWVGDHPKANDQGYVLQHRLVMARHLGLEVLPDDWQVHHKLPCEGGSGSKTDNRPENLVCFASLSLHVKWHALLTKHYDLPSRKPSWVRYTT